MASVNGMLKLSAERSASLLELFLRGPGAGILSGRSLEPGQGLCLLALRLIELHSDLVHLLLVDLLHGLAEVDAHGIPERTGLGRDLGRELGGQLDHT